MSFMFSLLPLCHGACGVAKYIVVFSAAAISRCFANSEPLSRVSDLTLWFLRHRIIANAVSSELCVFSRAATKYRDFLSTHVNIEPFPTPPKILSPSQSPIRSRTFASAGRSLIVKSRCIVLYLLRSPYFRLPLLLRWVFALYPLESNMPCIALWLKRA